MIVVHPMTRAAMTAARPTAPAPVMAIEEPAGAQLVQDGPGTGLQSAPERGQDLQGS